MRVYRVPEFGYIVAKKIFVGCSRIIFIDKATDGLLFSYTIDGNFSTKNINAFLGSKFNEYEEIKTLCSA